MKLILQSIATAGLCAIIAFCVFGFMASYEYSEVSRRFPWQISYGAIGTSSLFAIILLWRPRQ